LAAITGLVYATAGKPIITNKESILKVIQMTSI